jgi:hypothetical protein
MQPALREPKAVIEESERIVLSQRDSLLVLDLLETDRAAQDVLEATAIPADKRAKVHIAGLNNPAFEQRCDRCHCVLVPRGDKSWEPGTAVAYFGHGHWSRLDPHEASDHSLYRACGRVRAGPWFAHIINCMTRAAQLIRDLFSVKCSETEALRRLLQSDPMAAMPRKLGDSGDGSIRTASGIFLAIWIVVVDLIVYCKIAISRRRA